MKQRESCDPDQSVQPCLEMTESEQLFDSTVASGSSSGVKASGKEKGERPFGPKKQENKRSRAMEELKNVVVSAIEKYDKTHNLIKYFREENKRPDNMNYSFSKCCLLRMHPS